MYECLKSGAIINVDEKETLSDGTAGGIEKDSITFALCQKLIDHTVLVSEADIKEAIKYLAINESMIIEGAAGVAVAGAIKRAHTLKGKKIAAIVCGRNIAFATFLEIMKEESLINSPTSPANL